MWVTVDERDKRSSEAGLPGKRKVIERECAPKISYLFHRGRRTKLSNRSRARAV